mgnify:CR=1 FL=1
MIPTFFVCSKCNAIHSAEEWNQYTLDFNDFEAITTIEEAYKCYYLEHDSEYEYTWFNCPTCSEESEIVDLKEIRLESMNNAYMEFVLTKRIEKEEFL